MRATDIESTDLLFTSFGFVLVAVGLTESLKWPGSNIPSLLAVHQLCPSHA